MRIVLVSDTHGRHDDVDVPDDGDLLIHAGDITRHGRRAEVVDFADWFDLRPHPAKVVVGGNHDRWVEQHPEKTRAILPGDTYLQDEARTVDGTKIWGGPWTPKFFDWSFMLPRGEELAAKWAQIPEDTDVVVTHGPPEGICDETHAGTAVGSETLRERIFEIEPRLHVFGHIHEARGRVHRRGITLVNASCPNGERPFVVDLDR